MLTSWANLAVIGALGLGIGMVGRLVGLVTTEDWRVAIDLPRKTGETWLQWRRRISETQTAAQTPAMNRASLSFGALIVVLVLVVILSPVELGWWELLVSLLAGVVLIEAVYRLAKAGRLPKELGSRFDPIR
jgi:membrane protein required for beta-lactamase induction